MDRTSDRRPPRWRIGELAERTGLSVRALRHYDQLGLLVPSERSLSGYRLYSDSDLRRLYRIVALRQLGMSLEQIAHLLVGPGADLREVIRGQLEALERQRELQERLHARLTSILEALDRQVEPSSEKFIEAIEVTMMIEKYYTPDQLEQLKERERQLGPEAIEQAQRDWEELIAEVRREQARGSDPTSPPVLALARRWQELIEQFTGGDPGVRASLTAMYQNEPAEAASRGALDNTLMEYVGKALEALDRAE